MTFEQISPEEFRAEVRAWLEANFDRWPNQSIIPSPADDVSPADVASGRVLQRKLFEGGLAGISYPKESEERRVG